MRNALLGSAYHPAGANFAFADGSVRFLADSMNLFVYQALGSRSGKEAMGDF